MSEYLRKWENDYRCIAVYDLKSGEFPRSNGNLDGTDIYIPCYGKDMIYDYDSSCGELIAHFDAKARCKGVLQKLYETFYKDFERFTSTKMVESIDEATSTIVHREVVIVHWNLFIAHVKTLKETWAYDIEDNDSEMWFKFKGNKHMTQVAKLMKTKKPMAVTSPFNAKFLPSHKVKMQQTREANSRYIDYETPKGYYDEAKQLFINISKTHKFKVGDASSKIQKDYCKFKKRDLITEADEKNYKFNHYLLEIKLWDDYLKFLRSY